MPVDVIKENLLSRGVIDVRRITRYENGSPKNTTAVITNILKKRLPPKALKSA